jgi:hypothetical protein
MRVGSDVYDSVHLNIGHIPKWFEWKRQFLRLTGYVCIFTQPKLIPAFTCSCDTVTKVQEEISTAILPINRKKNVFCATDEYSCWVCSCVRQCLNPQLRGPVRNFRPAVFYVTNDTKLGKGRSNGRMGPTFSSMLHVYPDIRMTIWLIIRQYACYQQQCNN